MEPVNNLKDKLIHTSSQLNFEWKVEGFCSLSEEAGYYYESPSFAFSDATFNLQIFPTGCDKKCKDESRCISLHIKGTTSAPIEFTVGIKNNDGTLEHIVKHIHDFSTNTIACIKNLYNRSKFLLNKPKLSPNGDLTLTLNFTNNSQRSLVPASTTFSKPVSIQMEESLKTNINTLRNKFISDISHFNTKWLEEQNTMKVPPPAVSSGAAQLPLKYDSYESYVSSFYPMLMLEVWEQIYIESKEVFESKKKHNKFHFSVLSYTSKIDLIELKCEAVVNAKVCFPPCEGYMTILELKENEEKCRLVFGYINRHKSEPLNLNNLKLSHWTDLPKKWTTDAKHWTFYVNIKKKEMTFALDSLMKGNGLCYIRNKLRQLDALNYLKNSPLLTDILQPKWETFFVKYSAMAPTREFNSGQMEVIEYVTSEIIKSRSEPKIILLQGPPGTGKTRTIIGLIESYLTKSDLNPSCKILVTAPSNAAIDEIGRRLIDLDMKFKPRTIKFVRVGMLEQIHPKMKPYTLDWETNFPCSDPKQKEKELQHLRSEKSKLKKAFNRELSSRNERLKFLEDKYKQLTDENFVNQRDGYADAIRKQTILEDSHIILSTLSSCSTPRLSKIFNEKSNFKFSYCIVDESTQCTELEILQPLMLGIRKLILIGDHKQLPATVLSKTACKYGFERSTFEKFHIYFGTYCKKKHSCLR